MASAPAAAPVPLFEAGPYMSLVPQFDAKTTRMADPKRAWMEVNGITGRHEPLSKLYGAVGAAGSKPVPPQVFVRPVRDLSFSASDIRDLNALTRAVGSKYAEASARHAELLQYSPNAGTALTFQFADDKAVNHLSLPPPLAESKAACAEYPYAVPKFPAPPTDTWQAYDLLLFDARRALLDSLHQEAAVTYLYEQKYMEATRRGKKLMTLQPFYDGEMPHDKLDHIVSQFFADKLIPRIFAPITYNFERVDIIKPLEWLMQHIRPGAGHGGSSTAPSAWMDMVIRPMRLLFHKRALEEETATDPDPDPSADTIAETIALHDALDRLEARRLGGGDPPAAAAGSMAEAKHASEAVGIKKQLTIGDGHLNAHGSNGAGGKREKRDKSQKAKSEKVKAEPVAKKNWGGEVEPNADAELGSHSRTLAELIRIATPAAAAGDGSAPPPPNYKLVELLYSGISLDPELHGDRSGMSSKVYTAIWDELFAPLNAHKALHPRAAMEHVFVELLRYVLMCTVDYNALWRALRFQPFIRLHGNTAVRLHKDPKPGQLAFKEWQDVVTSIHTDLILNDANLQAVAKAYFHVTDFRFSDDAGLFLPPPKPTAQAVQPKNTTPQHVAVARRQRTLKRMFWRHRDGRLDATA